MVRIEIVATGEVDLKGQKSEVVASGENDIVATGEVDLKGQKSEVGVTRGTYRWSASCQSGCGTTRTLKSSSGRVVHDLGCEVR